MAQASLTPLPAPKDDPMPEFTKAVFVDDNEGPDGVSVVTQTASSVMTFGEIPAFAESVAKDLARQVEGTPFEGGSFRVDWAVLVSGPGTVEE